MSNELAVRTQAVDVDELTRVAKMLALSGYFDGKGTDATAIAKVGTAILAGREMGYGPFASVTGIHVIKGKPTIAANLMASAVKDHPRYDYRVRKMDEDEVTIEFFEGGESLGVSKFTMEDAKKTGQTGKDVWKSFPRNMLFARALSNGVRWYCPDVFNGNTVYTPDEMGADVDNEGNAITGTWQVSEPDEDDFRGTTVAPLSDDDESIDNPFDGDEELAMSEIIQTWRGPLDAQIWAIKVGACDNEHAARNAFKKAVTAVTGGNNLKQSQLQDVYIWFYNDRMEKLEFEKAQDVAS